MGREVAFVDPVKELGFGIDAAGPFRLIAIMMGCFAQ